MPTEAAATTSQANGPIKGSNLFLLLSIFLQGMRQSDAKATNQLSVVSSQLFPVHLPKDLPGGLNSRRVVGEQQHTSTLIKHAGSGRHAAPQNRTTLIPHSWLPQLLLMQQLLLRPPP